MWKWMLFVAIGLSGYLAFLDDTDKCYAPKLQTSPQNRTKNENRFPTKTRTSARRICSSKGEFLLLTVATNQTDGYQRFIRSAGIYDIPVQVLGMNQKWLGGDMNYPGGGFKINLLKEELRKYKDDPEKIIMFTDSYDVIMLAPVEKILERFDNLDAHVVFSAEGLCWPDQSLESSYPRVQKGKRFLNSGGFIGYASQLYDIITSSQIKNTDDDQLFFTKIYLNKELRDKFNIKLDHRSTIFQNLNGATSDVELRFKGREAYLQNTVYNTNPLVVHGNGHSKLVLNSLGNYLANSWNPEDGCLSCWDNSIGLEDKPKTAYPKVLIAIFIEQPTPFLEEFFQKILNLEYPKNKLHLFIHNNVKFHEESVDQFISKHADSYKSVKRIDQKDEIKEKQARSLAIDYFQTKKCDYFLNLDSEAHLDNPNSLALLIVQNRSIVAPLLLRPFKAWSNFWGALTPDGYYARSSDYMDIIHNERRGLWNVPYVSACYLINASVINNPETRPVYSDEHLDADMSFCKTMRDRNVFMYISNRMDFGHLINGDNYNTSKINSEIYQVFDNRWDWEQRYLHENYSENFNPNKTAMQPCPDVYWFPIVNPRFCKEFIEIMEAFGQWSDGTNKDPRLLGGYENVPTRDIHMNQVGLEPHWLEFLKQYVRPLQEMVFTGYIHDDPRIEGGYEAVPTRDIHMKQVGLGDMWDFFLEEFVMPLQQSVFIGYTNPPRSLMNFVVRYRPDEQPSLRPHHDSSTYTINLALNRPNIDYKGGGCRFIRYNCSVTDTRLGWMLLHPGRLTHYHEGLRVTSGTRYIMISFVDP